MIGAKVIVILCCLGASVAAAQQTGANWKRVEALPSGTTIRLSTEGRRSDTCSLVSVTEDSLTCVSTRMIFFFPVHKQMDFVRAEIRSVKLSRRGLSMLTGAAIGMGAGIGAGIDAQAKNQAEDGHLVPVLFGFIGGMLGAGVGSHQNFLEGPTIYRMP